jgi:hypothetical protein
MVKKIKLMSDYGCFPLWEYLDGELVDNVNPDDLPLSTGLKTALHKWAISYDLTLDEEYPPNSGFRNPAEAEAFEVQGREMWRELQSQLGPDFKILYYSVLDRKLYE